MSTFTPYEYPVGYPESFKISEEVQRERHNQQQEYMVKTCYNMIMNATRHKEYRIFVDNGSCSGDLSKLNREALKEMVPGLTSRYDGRTWTFSWPITFLYEEMSILPGPQEPDIIANIPFTVSSYPEGYPENFKMSEEAQREAHKQDVERTTKGCYDMIVDATHNKQYRIFVNNCSGVGNPADLDTEALKEMVPGIWFRYDKYSNDYTISWPITFLV